MLLRILAIFCFAVCFSCGRQTNNTPTALFGTWALDSTSGRGGKIISGGPREHTEFTLQPNNSFTYYWRDFDVSNDFTGVYKYEKTPEGIAPKLIFSIYSSEKKDSVIHEDTLTVLKLSDSLLRAEENESYMTPDSIYITQKRINVYRKISRKK